MKSEASAQIEIEVFPDGSGVWVGRGVATISVNGRLVKRATYTDWFEFDALTEIEAFQVAVNTIVAGLRDSKFQ